MKTYPFAKECLYPNCNSSVSCPARKSSVPSERPLWLSPWVREVMAVGEEMTAKEVIARIKENNTPRTGTSLMQGSERKHTRNLRNLPTANSLSYILGSSGEYERVKNDGTIIWRRVV